MTDYEYFNSRLHYDPITGLLWWIRIEEFTKYNRTWNTRFAGNIAGWLRPDGYIKVRVDGKSHYAHRIIWLLMTGEWPPEGFEVDHIGNDTDNTWTNLRLATHSENGSNSRKHLNTINTLKGAYWNARNQKWLSQIQKDCKVHYLGYYDTEEAAHQAYCRASAEYHGDFQWRWQRWPNFSLGAGYTIMRSSLDLNDTNFPGAFRLNVRGPEGFFKVSF